MSILYSFKGAFKRGSNNFTKILLLGIGLSAGLLLMAKIWFELSYDRFLPYADRVYMIYMEVRSGGDGQRSYQSTAGGIAFAIKEYSPRVEVATRYTELFSDALVQCLDSDGSQVGNKYNARTLILTDTNFFKIFHDKVTGMNPNEGLNVPNNAYISRTLADRLTGSKVNNASNSIIGSVIAPTFNKNMKLNIVGVYEDYPFISSLHDVDMIISLSSIGQFMWDGSNGLTGNERYYSYVKLVKGADPGALKGDIDKMCKNKLPLEDLEKAQVSLGFHIEPLKESHLKDPDNKKIFILMLFLAISVMTVAVLNYVLITISAMVHKSKMIAVRRCYGALPHNIFAMVFSDVFVHLILSLLLVVFIVLSCSNTVEYIIGNNVGGLFSSTSLIFIASICLIVFFFCGLFPGIVYSHIPVATAFRRYKESSRKWKYFLLFIQYVASAFFISLLVVIMMQYKYLTNAGTGYSYKNLIYVNVADIYANKKDVIKSEVQALPFVEDAVFSNSLPINTFSGNNIYLPGETRELFNIADFYNIGKDYLKILKIPIIEGSDFNHELSGEVMVSRSFSTKIQNMTGWKDGVIGKQVRITEHSLADNTNTFTICGVYEDFVLGNHIYSDPRPSVMFNGEAKTEPVGYNWLLIKLKEMTPDNIAAVDNILKKISADGEMSKSYAVEMNDQYAVIQRVKDAIMMVGIIILFITIIGLIGYVQDEINRRRSEVAVRKINGATLEELINLFVKNVMKLAVPALIIGVSLAYYVGGILLESMKKRITLHWWIFASVWLLLFIIIAIVVTIKTFRVANANPVENLRSE